MHLLELKKKAGNSALLSLTQDNIEYWPKTLILYMAAKEIANRSRHALSTLYHPFLSKNKQKALPTKVSQSSNLNLSRRLWICCLLSAVSSDELYGFVTLFTDFPGYV